MKPTLSVIVVIVILFVTLPLQATTPVYSQESPPFEEITPEVVDFPEIEPGQSPETSALLPLAEMESVEIYEPSASDPQPDPPQISVGVEPQIYLENFPIDISWNLLNLEPKAGVERTIRFTLPEDLIPADPAINSQVTSEGVLILPVSDLSSSIEFTHLGVIEDDQDYIYISLELLEDGSCKLLRRWIASYKQVDELTGEETIYRTQRYFLQFDGGEIGEVKTSSAAFCETFGKHGNELKKFMKEQKLKVRNPQHLRSLVSYYNMIATK